jgi:DUF2924 family protein
MKTSILKEIDQLKRMTVTDLRRRYREVFGEETRSHHKAFLYRRIAWRLQVDAEGGLSARARRRAMEIANDADLRTRAPQAPARDDTNRAHRTTVSKLTGVRDPRLPKPGTQIPRVYKGRTHFVEVLDDGFQYEGRRYRSLSKIAQEVTGTRWNGFTFFGLTGKQENGRA